MWKPFDGSVVNIQTHFQSEEHIVFLKMSKDLSVKYETKIRDQNMSAKNMSVECGNHLMDPFNFPFNGKVV